MDTKLNIIRKAEGLFIDTAAIKPHPQNPREAIDITTDDFLSFAASIEQQGVIEPLVITSHGNILAGHRRLAAARLKNLALVPIAIRDLKEGEYPEDFFLAENAQRANLSVLEEARALKSLKDRWEKHERRSVTNKDLSRRLHMGQEAVSQRMILLDLPAKIQGWFHVGDISIATARNLMRLHEFPEEQESVAAQLVARELRNRDLDGVVTQMLVELGVRKAEETKEKKKKAPPVRSGANVAGDRDVVVNRDVAYNNLKANSSKTISLFDIRLLMESQICRCGMAGDSSLCDTCPIPKFVNGIVGRATQNGDRSAEYFTEEDFDNDGL